MPQSLVSIPVHVVFSTKDRRPFLRDAGLRGDLHAYLGGTFNGLDSPALAVGGVADHVHALIGLGKTRSISEVVREVKKASSSWAKEQSRDLRAFAWQSGYGAFGISPSHDPAVRQYIADQEEHHRTVSFQDEFRTLCRKYGVDLDERYVWD